MVAWRKRSKPAKSCKLVCRKSKSKKSSTSYKKLAEQLAQALVAQGKSDKAASAAPKACSDWNTAMGCGSDPQCAWDDNEKKCASAGVGIREGPVRLFGGRKYHKKSSYHRSHRRSHRKSSGRRHKRSHRRSAHKSSGHSRRRSVHKVSGRRHKRVSSKSRKH